MRSHHLKKSFARFVVIFSLTMAPPDFSKETLNGQAAEIGPGAWVLGVAHTAGGFANLRLNNRMFVFKLKLKKDMGVHLAGNDVLFLYGLGTEPSVQGVKKLEETTGLKAAAAIITSSWPNAAAGFFDGVDCVLHNQLFVHGDHVAGAWRNCAETPRKASNMDFFTMMPALGAQDSASDEPVFYYAPLKLIVYGHQWEFVYRPKGYKDDDPIGLTGGWVWTKLLPSMMFKSVRFNSCFANDPGQRLHDPAVHAAQWQDVMKWDFEYVTGHHDPPGVCGPIDNDAIIKGEGGVKGYMKCQLEASGELNNHPVPGSWYPWRYKNALQNALDNEPSFVKKYGPPEPLHFGGPGYGLWTRWVETRELGHEENG